METSHSPVLYRYSLFMSFAVVVLIFMGGLVTSTGSGLSVPDWPLSFGQFFPPMVGGVIFEHSHRVVATFIGLFTIGLFILLHLKQNDRLLRFAGWAAIMMVIIQGVLGGVTVLLGLSPLVSILHATLGQAFLCLVVFITVLVSPYWSPPDGRFITSSGSRIPPLSFLITAALFAQLLLGAAIRHSGKGLHGHIALGITVAILVHWTYKMIRKTQERNPTENTADLKRLSLILLLLTDTQILFGLASYLLRFTPARFSLPELFSAVIVSIHVMIGALLLAWSVVVALWTVRPKLALRPV